MFPFLADSGNLPPPSIFVDIVDSHQPVLPSGDIVTERLQLRLSWDSFDITNLISVSTIDFELIWAVPSSFVSLVPVDLQKPRDTSLSLER